MMCSRFGLVLIGMFLERSELENLERGLDSPRKLQFLRNPHAGHLEQAIPRRWKGLHVRGVSFGEGDVKRWRQAWVLGERHGIG